MMLWEKGDAFNCPHCSAFVGSIAHDLFDGMEVVSGMFAKGVGMQFEDGDPFMCLKCDRDLMSAFQRGKVRGPLIH